jgi:hypothetical protein
MTQLPPERRAALERPCCLARIIRRYNLNVGNREHGRLYIVDDNYVGDKLKMLMSIKGEMGLVIRLVSFLG